MDHECKHCKQSLSDDDLVHTLQISTKYKGYVHDYCFAEFLYDHADSYALTWHETKELDGLNQDE